MSQKKGKSKGLSGRSLATRVKTAKGRKISSTNWLQRQLNDPYVAEAKKKGFRSRAAFKLIELDDRFHFLTAGANVVDLGAAPGGWTQIAIERVEAIVGTGMVTALDINEMAPIKGAEILQCDFLDDEAPSLIKATLTGPTNVILSDMAAPATGHTATDHMRIIGLCESAFDFAQKILAPDGAFVCKVLQGGTEQNLLNLIKRSFKSVRHAKPPASRSNSAEMYVVALGFKGQSLD